jgi:hypothetical protein
VFPDLMSGWQLGVGLRHWRLRLSVPVRWAGEQCSVSERPRRETAAMESDTVETEQVFLASQRTLAWAAVSVAGV